MNAPRLICPKCGKRLVLKDRRPFGRKGTCPACGHRFVFGHDGADGGGGDAAERPERLVVASSPERGPRKSQIDSPIPGRGGESVEDARPIDVVADIGAERRAVLNRRRARGRRQVAVAAAVLLVASAIGAGIVLLRRDSASDPDVEAALTAHAGDIPPVVERNVPHHELAHTLDEAGHPHNEPIRLYMVPSGARLLVHLRPADLWSDEDAAVELRASLTENVTSAVERRLRELTGRPAWELEELLLAWILGARGSEPQLAVVARLAREEPLSDLIQEFGGEPADDLAQRPVFLRDDRAVLICDSRTLAFAPRALAGELAEWVDTPNHNTSDGVLALLEQTDRRRLLSVIFDPAEVERHLDGLFSESTRRIAALVTAWFAQFAETVLWSVDTGGEFTSEIVLRPRSVEASTTLLARVTASMESVPAEMVAGVRRLDPQRMGFRRLIGRFPAMLEVSRRATVTGVDERAVRLTTTLPAKAGPNLALGSVLTWDEWMGARSVSARDEPSATSRPDSDEWTMQERLRLPVDAEFSRTPLQEAIDYIAAEIDLPIDIDGDALREAGYTKNMPQSFNLGRVSAAAALQRILQQYQEPGKEMVIVLDERRQRATILTRPFAERRGLEPLQLRP